MRNNNPGLNPRIRAGIKKATPAELSFDINEKTLTLHNNPSSASIKSLTFELDTNCDIILTVYPFCIETRDCQEDKNRVKDITCNYSKIKPTVMKFTKGINLIIPIGQCIIDFASINDKSLEANFDKDYYPLIIKVERMMNSEDNTEKTNNSNNKNPKIQKLFAYFSFTKQNNEYKCKFLKKGIEVSDRFLWLKDVFGPNSSISKKHIPKEEQEICSICFINRVNTIITPCRHMCLCYTCADI